MISLKTAVLIGLGLFASTIEGSGPGSTPQSSVSLAYTNLFDKQGASKGSVVVWNSRNGKLKELDGYQVWQWSNAWNGLVLTRDSSVYRWDSAMTTPRKVIDLATVVSSPLYSVPGVVACSVDRTGRYLAVRLENGLAVVDLWTNKVSRKLTLNQISRAIHQELSANIWCCGIDYSSKGWLALSIPTRPWKGATDGCGPAQCLVISPEGKMKSLGLGTPVAWIGNDAVLCYREEANSDRVSPEVFHLSGGRASRCKAKGLLIGWNGNYVLLAKKHSLEVLDRWLKKRISVVPFPTWNPDNRGPMVGIPARDSLLRVSGQTRAFHRSTLRANPKNTHRGGEPSP